MEITSDEKKIKNLLALTDEYRNKGRAFKGYNNLHKAILDNRYEYLSHKLRNHKDEEIETQFEVDFRDEVDFLIKFYSFLELAILTDYVPAQLTGELNNEIKEILGYSPVKKYYEEYYSLMLPQLLFKVVTEEKYQKPIGDPIFFSEILILDRSIDDDVENFLWLLDDGLFDDSNIDDLLKILGSRRRIKTLLDKPRKDENEMDSAFWGFIKFTDYMTRYQALLKKCGDNEVLRSALWHFQSYWFVNIKKQMQKVYITAVKEIEKLNVVSRKQDSGVNRYEERAIHSLPAGLKFSENIQIKSVKRRIGASGWKVLNSTDYSAVGVKKKPAYKVVNVRTGSYFGVAGKKKISAVVRPNSQVRRAVAGVKYNLKSSHGKALKELLLEQQEAVGV